MTAPELIERLGERPLERLRWLVLKEFGVLPGSKTAARMKDKDLVKCGAHLVLDGRLASIDTSTEAADNSSFREDRFFELSGGAD